MLLRRKIKIENGETKCQFPTLTSDSYHNLCVQGQFSADENHRMRWGGGGGGHNDSMNNAGIGWGGMG